MVLNEEQWIKELREKRIAYGISLKKLHTLQIGGMVLNEEQWIKELREKRIAYGISQGRLAVASGITREYLNKIESARQAGGGFWYHKGISQ